ncbi:MAG: hypothetical protein Q7T45_21635 [Bradyrhizobium sp.]|uniref:hypothetical protein n=1 Tax=Bradyrhizobium sp. TaxID=376 RepID=UPI0027279B87|nr:hypothetical protein [Bradyrhizobium sp.]MDO8400425.1 hypothetical protein [Bradyrhizobium sp.]
MAAAWAKPASAKPNDNENIDAPKIKARERPALSAIITPTLFYLLWARLAGAASECSCLLATNSRRGHPARISPSLVTGRRLHGQEKDCAVYIDCKLQQLDCGSIDL